MNEKAKKPICFLLFYSFLCIFCYLFVARNKNILLLCIREQTSKYFHYETVKAIQSKRAG